MKRGEADDYRAYKNLWLSVFWQAVCDATRLKNARRPHQRLHAEDAMAWFASDELRVGSFVWICDLIHLDPVRVRVRVLVLIEVMAADEGLSRNFVQVA